MWETMFQRRKEARRLAGIARRGLRLARAGRTDEARVLYSQATHLRHRVYVELTGKSGRDAALRWNRKAVGMLTPLAAEVTPGEI